MGLGFLGSSAANPGGKYPLYNIKIEKEELLADCGATETHGCGVSKNSLEAISGRCDVRVSRILFLESVSEAGVVFLQFCWRPCEPAGRVPWNLWVRFGRFGGRQEREN